MDDLDREIVGLLQIDARRSNRDVATQLGISESTVRARMRRLQDSGAMRLSVVTNPETEGLTATAYLRILATPNRVDAVAAQLAGFTHIGYVATVAGRFNIVAVALAKDTIELTAFAEAASAIPGVQRVDVKQIVHSVKHGINVVRIMPTDEFS